MDETMQNLLRITNAGIHKRAANLPLNEKMDWDYLFHELAAGKLEAVCYCAIKDFTQKEGLSKERLKNWQKRASYMGIRQLDAYMKLKIILEKAKEQGIGLILFKGAALAQLYPEYLLRYSCDIDLLVSEKDKERAEKLLEKNGYFKNQQHSKENVLVYVLPGSLVIELHTRLWEDYAGKRVELLEKMDLVNENKLVIMHTCELEFVTLGYTEHLIYQMYHIIKHFSFQGMDLRHLTDTALYVNYFFEKIDFKDFWHKMKVLDYDVFVYHLFCICSKYFEMNKKALEYAQVNSKIDEDKLLDELFQAGMIGLKNYETMVASAIVYQTYYEKDSGEPSKLKVWKASIFPSASDLSDKYNYAKKNHLFLPFAWCHRAWNYLIGRLCRKEETGLSEHMKMAEQKFRILKELELIQKH